MPLRWIQVLGFKICVKVDGLVLCYVIRSFKRSTFMEHCVRHPNWQLMPLDEWKGVGEAESIGEVSEFSIRYLRRHEPPLGQVCGPISSGGLDSVEANFPVFCQYVDRLKQLRKVFDQTPFESRIFALIKAGKLRREKDELLQGFYWPIFRSGFVQTLYFMHGWEASHGAQWEHDQAQRFGLEIVYLPPDFLTSDSLVA